MSEKNKIETLTEIATEILVRELQRRADAQSMSTGELIEVAQANWDKAETDAEDLQNLGHDAE